MKSFSTNNYFYILLPIFCLMFTSCKKDLFNNNYTAYFGGEVVNPTSPYVLFYKGNVVRDTIMLNKDNTFFIKFDSLTPGLYSFKNEPEFQYVYFDKNDSIKVHIDTKDFDNSIVFCGRGEEKNNFLMEMYLRNEKDKENIFNLFDRDFNTFNSYNLKNNQENIKVYNSKKKKLSGMTILICLQKQLQNYHIVLKEKFIPLFIE